MTGATANAELVNGVRQRPNVAKAEAFQVDTEYYLFNDKARMFFLGANDWSTRASIGNKGYKVKVVASEYAPEGSYEFQDSVETKKEWLCVFATSDAGAIWVDNSTETYRNWEFTENNGKYRISNNDLAGIVETISGTFLGWNGTDDTRLYFVNPATEGVGVDWVFVTEETYNAWQETWASMKDQYDAAAELLTYMNSAKEMNLDVAAEQAVYENEAATVEELNAATAAVQKKISDALSGNATVENPADMTGSLMNPNFDGHSADGWKGDKPGFGNNPHPAAEVAEFYGKDKYDMYQDLNGLPAGVYKLSANAYNRGAWEGHAEKKDYVVYLYAHADKDTLTTYIMNAWDAMNTEPLAGETSFGTTAGQEEQTHDGETYYIPNDPSGARVLFERGLYLNNLYFMVEDGSARIGIGKNKKIYDWDWECVDNFKLTYYGKSAEAYQYYIKNAVAKKEYTDVNVSEQYLKAYEAAFNVTATNKAEAKVAHAAIVAAEDSITANVNLWKELKEKYEVGIQKAIDNNQLLTAGELSEYLSYTVEDGTEITNDAEMKSGDFDLSNAELQAIVNKIDELMEAVDKEAKEKLEPGQDVTEFITNPDFENGKNGWTVVSNGGGNVQLGGNDANHCFEAWHSTNFDVYQEVNDLPMGVYEVSVQGYVRYLDGNDAINNKADEPENVPIYVYMNDSKSKLPSWFAYPKSEEFYNEISGAAYLPDGDGFCYPDNMIAASAAFAEGGYAQTAKCLVAESGSVTRIGVKGTPEAKFWPIFDNFKLTYLGYAVDVVKPLLEEKIAEAESVEIDMTTKSAKEALATALADANKVKDGEDGTAMFRATAKLDKAISDVQEGKVLCESLLDEANAFLAYASESDSPLAQQGQQLAATILSDLEECKYDEADLKVQSLAIREMKLKMELPVDYTQGTAEGKDVTAFIQSPNFQKTKDGAEVNAIDGWQGTAGYNFGNDDTQKGALALEFYEKKFDMYQDLAGVGEVVLPKGNYRLQVNAFERVNDESPAFLYAVAGKDTLAITELMKHADGFNAAGGETGPGDMVSAVSFFADSCYLNQINFRFEGDTLRIGIMHKESNQYDWIIMDNFKLFFHGDDYTGVETVINLGKPVQVQYFTLDGRQVSAARKGLVIRKTIMDNGAVIVRKMQK